MLNYYIIAARQARGGECQVMLHPVNMPAGAEKCRINRLLPPVLANATVVGSCPRKPINVTSAGSCSLVAFY